MYFILIYLPLDEWSNEYTERTTRGSSGYVWVADIYLLALKIESAAVGSSLYHFSTY